jgi:hypothetical protein
MKVGGHRQLAEPESLDAAILTPVTSAQTWKA